MAKEILIQVVQDERRVAILGDGKLDDFYIELDRHQSMLGNIYKGKVESILPSINGAFVNIGQEKNGFLYLTDADNPFLNDIEKIEDELNLSAPQKILNMIFPKPAPAEAPPAPQEPQARNNRPPQKDKNELPLKKDQEILVQGEKEIFRDSKFLVNKWQEIRELSKKKQPPALIYEEGSLIWRVIRDLLKDDVQHVIIDSQEEFVKMRKFAQNLIGPEVVDKILYHPGPQTLFDAKNVARELDKIYEPKVYLKSGAYVVIEPTEGVTVVDVNSGRFKGRGTPEDAAFAVNMEAAPEIARQAQGT